MAALLASCADDARVGITVTNPSAERRSEVVELPAADILSRLDAAYCYVTDADGRELPSQITYDSLLVFMADVAPGASADYTVCPSDTARSYAPVATGRIYPERADDLAWENDLVGFRAYGPATQAKGERAFGYDIFFKYPSEEPVLEKLYGPETDPATWARVDSLRAVDPALAQAYIDSFSYHIDHGMGMDCYAVGPTLGAGVAAVFDADTICFPWCYAKAEALDRGPLRFTARLDFAPRDFAGETAVAEHRIISLDAGSRLNRCAVWFDGLKRTHNIAAGFPRRDSTEAVMMAPEGIIAYADPTQGPDNGKALLGVVFDAPVLSAFESRGHILGLTAIEPGDTLRYRFGFSWSRTGMPDLAAWHAHLAAAASAQPLTVALR